MCCLVLMRHFPTAQTALGGFKGSWADLSFLLKGPKVFSLKERVIQQLFYNCSIKMGGPFVRLHLSWDNLHSGLKILIFNHDHFDSEPVSRVVIVLYFIIQIVICKNSCWFISLFFRRVNSRSIIGWRDEPLSPFPSCWGQIVWSGVCPSGWLSFLLL